MIAFEPSVGEQDTTFESHVDANDDEVAQISFSWWLAILLGVFGVSSWVAINGLWMELPLLVNKLPEQWNLPAYLSILIQIANFLPLLYIILTRVCRSVVRIEGGFCLQLIQPPERLANYSILIIGLISLLLLTEFWDATAILPGLPPNFSPTQPNTHSIGLFVLTFSLGMIDCMSSITFLAYLANLPATYAGALLFGETCSGLVPAILALIQGANSEPTCHNTTSVDNVTSLTAVFPPPRFSVNIFMGLVAGITFLSLIAFLLLDCLPTGVGRTVTLSYRKLHSVPHHSEPDQLDTGLSLKDNTKVANVNDDSPINEVEFYVNDRKLLFSICFILTSYASFLMNGFLPSMQSFSTNSYSSLAYHLSVTLSGITAPTVAMAVTAYFGYEEFGKCLQSICCMCRSRRDDRLDDENVLGLNEQPPSDFTDNKILPTPINRYQMCWNLLIMSGVCSIPAAYIIYLASTSPTPPNLGGMGSTIAICAWILLTAGFTAQRTWITLYLVKYGSQRNLRVLGAATQLGSLVGAIISFLLTAILKVFEAKHYCV